MDDVGERRRTMRAAGRLARSRVTGRARATATAAIVAHLLDLDAVTGTSPVLLTAAVGDELDLVALRRALAARGTTVLLPVVDGDDLVAVPWTPGTALEPGWQGVPEPVGPPSTRPPGTVIVPALALDRRGGRLGYGGGHFDRYLAGPAAGATTVGAVFDAQLVEEVPVLPHDVPLDVVVTEHGVWWRGDSSG